MVGEFVEDTGALLLGNQHPFNHSEIDTNLERLFQEEALCYSSTLYATLQESYYPWPNLGPGSVAGVFSPGVVVFKDDLDHECVELAPEERRVVSVLTVAAPRWPAVNSDRRTLKNQKDLEDFRGKIRLVYRMAAHNSQQYLVLGALLLLRILRLRADVYYSGDGMWSVCMSSSSRGGRDEVYLAGR